MKKKILYSIFLGAVLSSTGAAAITGGGGGGGVNFIFDAFSGIVAGEVNSWMDLLLVVILPFLGVYGVSRYLTGKALEIAESNFAGSDSYGGTELGSTEKRMAQFISLAIAAPVVMYFGNIIPFFSLLLSGIAVIWFGWQFIGGGLSSKWSRSGGSETETSDNSSILKDAGEKATDIANTGMGGIKKGIERAEAANEKRKEDTEGRKAAKELHDKLQEFEEAEKELEEVLEKDYGEIRNTLIEDKKAVKLDEQEEEELERILNFAGVFEAQMTGGPGPDGKGYGKQGDEGIIKRGGRKGLIDQVQETAEEEGIIEGNALISLENSPQDFNYAYVPYLKKLKEEAKIIRSGKPEREGGVKAMVEEAKKEDSLIDDEASTTIQDLQELIEAQEIINKLAKAANVLEKEDAELEKIARDVKDEELAEEVQVEENVEKKISSELGQIENREEEILKTLKEADEYLQRIIKLDQEEIDELRAEIQEDGKIEKNLAKLEKTIKDYRNSGVNVTNYQEVMEEIENLRTVFNEIDEYLQKLGNMKSNEEQEIGEVHSDIRQAIKEIEGNDTKEIIRKIQP